MNRLKELEATKEIVKHDSDFVRVPIYARLDGYKLALADLEPVLAAARGLLLEQHWVEGSDGESRCIPSKDVLRALRDALELV